MTAEAPRRFVVLRHEGPQPHWDWMFETGPTLRTFHMAIRPDQGGHQAREIAAHRRIYLDYEGPVGVGRGRVCRLDSGVYTGTATLIDVVEVELHGLLFRGRLTLCRSGSGDLNWSVAWQPRMEKRWAIPRRSDLV